MTSGHPLMNNSKDYVISDLLPLENDISFSDFHLPVLKEQGFYSIRPKTM